MEQRQDSFYSFYYRKTIKSAATYVSTQRILMSGDVELNLGPIIAITTENISFSNPNFILHCRMFRDGLRRLDVGGGGDCLFKSISHQLYGDSSHHVEIRAIGLGYLTDNPERFIEKVVDMTWLQYLSDMSIQGTWADNIKIQMQWF